MIAQLALFSEPAKRHLTIQEKMKERLLSPEIERGLLRACMDRPGEWLSPHDLWHQICELNASSVFGHVLARLARRGTLETIRIYYGAKNPADDGYMGYSCRWRFVPKESA